MAALCDIASWSLLVKLTQPWRTEKLFPELCQAGHLECQWCGGFFFFLHLPPCKETEENLSVCMFVCGSHLNSSFLHQLFRWSPKNHQRWWRTKKAAVSARKRGIGFVQEAAAVASFPHPVAPHCCHSCCCCCYTCRQSFLCSLGNRACSRVAWFRARRVVCGETDESY